MPLTGWLAGRFGIKNISSWSRHRLHARLGAVRRRHQPRRTRFLRALQGVAGAGLVPLSQATLLQINPPERHGYAMAVFGMGTIFGPIMGRRSAAG